jgi:hypothetical protein
MKTAVDFKKKLRSSFLSGYSPPRERRRITGQSTSSP